MNDFLNEASSFLTSNIDDWVDIRPSSNERDFNDTISEGYDNVRSSFGNFSSLSCNLHRRNKDKIVEIDRLIENKRREIDLKSKEHERLEKIWKKLIALDEAASEITKLGVVRSITQDVVLAVIKGDPEVILEYLDSGQFDQKVREHIFKTYKWLTKDWSRKKKKISFEELEESVDRLVEKCSQGDFSLEDGIILKNKLMVVVNAHPYVRMATSIAKGVSFFVKWDAQLKMEKAERELMNLREALRVLYNRRSLLLNSNGKGFGDFMNGSFGAAGTGADY